MGLIQIRKVGVFILAISLMSLIGCSSLNNTTALKIENKLEEKYGEKFVVTKIGNRLNRDTVTTYCTPENDSTLVFIAVMNKDETEFSDNYIATIIRRQAEMIINNSFKEVGIESQAKASASGLKEENDSTDSSMKIEDYISRFQPENFDAEIILSSEVSDIENIGSIIEQAYNNIYTKLGETTFYTTIRIIPNERFDECSIELQKAPDISEAWFSDYEMTKKLYLSIKNGELSLTNEEIANFFK